MIKAETSVRRRFWGSSQIKKLLERVRKLTLFQNRCQCPPGEAYCQFALRKSCTAHVSDGSKGEILAASRCFPLCSRERTCSGGGGISVLCQQRTHAPQQ